MPSLSKRIDISKAYHMSNARLKKDARRLRRAGLE